MATYANPSALELLGGRGEEQAVGLGAREIIDAARGIEAVSSKLPPGAGLAEGWFIVDSFSGRIIEANTSACRLFGVEDGELAGKRFWSLARPGEAALLRGKVEEAGGVELHRFEASLMRGDQRFDAELVVGQIDWDGAAAWQVLAGEKLGERLQQSGALAAGMAHGLKNVLQAILAFSHKGARGGKERSAELIAESVHRGERLVRKMLSPGLTMALCRPAPPLS